MWLHDQFLSYKVKQVKFLLFFGLCMTFDFPHSQGSVGDFCFNNWKNILVEKEVRDKSWHRLTEYLLTGQSQSIAVVQCNVMLSELYTSAVHCVLH